MTRSKVQLINTKSIKPDICQTKRYWVSPSMKNWGQQNIELAGGKGADGGTKAYVD